MKITSIDAITVSRVLRSNKLTYQQKQAIARQYGMSPKNYASLQLANYQLSEALKKSNLESTQEGISMTLGEVMAEAEALKQAADKLPEGNINGQIQMLNSGVAQTEILIGNLWGSIKSGFGLIGNHISSQKAKEAIDDQNRADTENAVNNIGTETGLVDDGL